MYPPKKNNASQSFWRHLIQKTAPNRAWDMSRAVLKDDHILLVHCCIKDRPRALVPLKLPPISPFNRRRLPSNRQVGFDGCKQFFVPPTPPPFFPLFRAAMEWQVAHTACPPSGIPHETWINPHPCPRPCSMPHPMPSLMLLPMASPMPCPLPHAPHGMPHAAPTAMPIAMPPCRTQDHAPCRAALRVPCP